MRSTRQRDAITRVLEDADNFRTAQEIHDQLKSAGERVGLTTVYRTLQALTRSGRADVLFTSEGESIYRICGTEEHHHHLVCRSCGLSVEIASDDVERWAEQTARLHGFASVTHTAEVYGECASCRGRRKS
jgi:Fur family transcriptional regulator, ferric uptake regulator